MGREDTPQSENTKKPRFPHAARLADEVKGLPWPDELIPSFRDELLYFRRGEPDSESTVFPEYVLEDDDQSSFRPGYWVIGRMMSKGEWEFMDNYLTTKDLGTSDMQLAVNILQINRERKGQKIDSDDISIFQQNALAYEKEQRAYFKEVHDGYMDLLSILNWAKVLDEAKRQNIPVEEHEDFEDFSLEGFIVSNIEDGRGISEQINDDIQNSMILESLDKDPTGLDLLQLREKAIRSRLLEEGEIPDTHPWLVGFKQGRSRFEQLVDYLIRNEDIAA